MDKIIKYEVNNNEYIYFKCECIKEMYSLHKQILFKIKENDWKPLKSFYIMENSFTGNPKFRLTDNKNNHYDVFINIDEYLKKGKSFYFNENIKRMYKYLCIELDKLLKD